MKVTQKVQHWLGRFESLAPLRKRAAWLLTMPWETPSLHALQLAEYFPRFKRGHDHEREAAEDMRIVRNYTMTKYDRCAVLHNLVRHVEVRGIPGDIVECGVWRGGSSGMMALANLRYGKTRRDLHLFDAWGDFPDPTAEDGWQFRELKEGTLNVANNDGALEACKTLLEGIIRYPADRIFYRQGVFDLTLPRFADTVSSISVLRLDCDWYNGVKQCLEAFYPRVVAGGVVVFDDYGWCEGAQRAVDEYLNKTGSPPFLHFVDYSCRYLIKP